MRAALTRDDDLIKTAQEQTGIIDKTTISPVFEIPPEYRGLARLI